MLTRVPYPYALSDAEAFVAHMQTGKERGFLIEHKTFGPIGMVGFNPSPPADASVLAAPEMGYWLGRTFWGRGFATEGSPWRIQQSRWFREAAWRRMRISPSPGTGSSTAS